MGSTKDNRRPESNPRLPPPPPSLSLHPVPKTIGDSVVAGEVEKRGAVSTAQPVMRGGRGKGGGGNDVDDTAATAGKAAVSSNHTKTDQSEDAGNAKDNNQNSCDENIYGDSSPATAGPPAAGAAAAAAAGSGENEYGFGNHVAVFGGGVGGADFSTGGSGGGGGVRPLDSRGVPLRSTLNDNTGAQSTEGMVERLHRAGGMGGAPLSPPRGYPAAAAAAVATATAATAAAGSPFEALYREQCQVVQERLHAEGRGGGSSPSPLPGLHPVGMGGGGGTAGVPDYSSFEQRATPAADRLDQDTGLPPRQYAAPTGFGDGSGGFTHGPVRPAGLGGGLHGFAGGEGGGGAAPSACTPPPGFSGAEVGMGTYSSGAAPSQGLHNGATASTFVPAAAYPRYGLAPAPVPDAPLGLVPSDAVAAAAQSIPGYPYAATAPPSAAGCTGTTTSPFTGVGAAAVVPTAHAYTLATAIMPSAPTSAPSMYPGATAPTAAAAVPAPAPAGFLGTAGFPSAAVAATAAAAAGAVPAAVAMLGHFPTPAPRASAASFGYPNTATTAGVPAANAAAATATAAAATAATAASADDQAARTVAGYERTPTPQTVAQPAAATTRAAVNTLTPRVGCTGAGDWRKVGMERCDGDGDGDGGGDGNGDGGGVGNGDDDSNGGSSTTAAAQSPDPHVEEVLRAARCESLLPLFAAKRVGLRELALMDDGGYKRLEVCGSLCVWDHRGCLPEVRDAEGWGAVLHSGNTSDIENAVKRRAVFFMARPARAWPKLAPSDVLHERGRCRNIDKPVIRSRTRPLDDCFPLLGGKLHLG